MPRSSPFLAAAATVAALLAPAPAHAGPAAVSPCRFTALSPSPAPAVVVPAHLPPGAVAYTSPDGFGGRRYILGPPGGRCVAVSGTDEDFNQRITLPGHRKPTYEQVFGAGGDSQIGYACRYLPTIRTYAWKYFQLTCPPTPNPVTIVPTSTPGIHAAIVDVPDGASDPQLATSGSGRVRAVVLAFDYGESKQDPHYRRVSTMYADCRAAEALCEASLHLFIRQAIDWQTRYNGLRVTGDPTATIRQALTSHP